MRPVEILTLAPLGALTVVFGLFPGLVLDLVVQGSVRAVLAARRTRPARGDDRPVSGSADEPMTWADLAVIAPLVAAIVLAAPSSSPTSPAAAGGRSSSGSRLGLGWRSPPLDGWTGTTPGPRSAAPTGWTT